MRQAPRSLLLITIDCFRADHAGFLGCANSPTPFLDSFAEESFVFSNAVASGIPTYYSLPALMSSRYPLALGRDLIGVAPGEHTIASELKECGFRTAAFSAANPYISTEFGYQQGFDTFADFLGDETDPLPAAAFSDSPGFRRTANRLLAGACRKMPFFGAAYDEAYFRYCQAVSGSRAETFDSLRRFPSADVIVDRAIEWLDQDSSSPFFLWLHLMDPHGPYYPSEQALRARHEKADAADARFVNSYWARADLSIERLQEKRQEIVALYDAGIWWADHQIRRLTQRMRDLKVLDKCAIAVTADHGEEFLEHGGRFHQPLKMTEELVRVPLLLHVPGISTRRTVSSAIGLIDLAPTLLHVLEISVPATFRGRSCWRELTAGGEWERPVFTECVYGCGNPFDRDKRLAARLLAVRKGPYKLVVNLATGNEELFALDSDPKELRPLSPGSTVELRRSLLELAKQHVVRSSNSRDYQLRLAAQTRELRSRWERSSHQMN